MNTVRRLQISSPRRSRLAPCDHVSHRTIYPLSGHFLENLPLPASDISRQFVPMDDRSSLKLLKIQRLDLGISRPVLSLPRIFQDSPHPNIPFHISLTFIPWGFLLTAVHWTRCSRRSSPRYVVSRSLDDSTDYPSRSRVTVFGASVEILTISRNTFISDESKIFILFHIPCLSL